MTARTNRIQAIFQDARELQADALEMLAQGKIRNAAAKGLGGNKGFRLDSQGPYSGQLFHPPLSQRSSDAPALNASST